MKQSKPVSTVVRMHAKWLYLEPRIRERHYWDEVGGGAVAAREQQ